MSPPWVAGLWSLIKCHETFRLQLTKMSIKQNFHTDCEAMINKQINMELYASYVYLSMTAFFSRFYMLRSWFSFLLSDFFKSFIPPPLNVLSSKNSGRPRLSQLSSKCQNGPKKVPGLTLYICIMSIVLPVLSLCS